MALDPGAGVFMSPVSPVFQTVVTVSIGLKIILRMVTSIQISLYLCKIDLFYVGADSISLFDPKNGLLDPKNLEKESKQHRNHAKFDLFCFQTKKPKNSFHRS